MESFHDGSWGGARGRSGCRRSRLQDGRGVRRQAVQPARSPNAVSRSHPRNDPQAKFGADINAAAAQDTVPVEHRVDAAVEAAAGFGAPGLL